MDGVTYGSLFSGVGGLDLGLDRAGFHCRWQIENEPYAIKVLEKHWPHVKRYGDITTVRGDELEPVDLICGGFPCQDLSQAGKRVGIEGTRSGLWFEYARIVGLVRPRFVLIENVPGLLVPGAMRRVVGELARLGYVGAWRSLRASEFGASHLRKRVFIIATLADPGYAERKERRLCADSSAGTPRAGYRNGGSSWREPTPRNGAVDVAHGTLRGLRELREPSGCNGVPDGSHEALGNRDFASANPRSPAGGSWRATRESGGHLADPINRLLQKQGRGPEGRDGAGSGSEELAHSIEPGFEISGRGVEGCSLPDGCGDDVPDSNGTGLAQRERKGSHGSALQPACGTEPSGLRVERMQFAPGPSDPRWPIILREHPDLAPALANPGHAKLQAGGGDKVSDQRWTLSASPDEPGTSPPQPQIRGVADGIPDWMDGAMNHRTKRLGRLGNAVVPQVAEWIGRQIREFDRCHA